MKSNKNLYIIIAIVVLVVIGGILWAKNRSAEEELIPTNDNEMVDCGQAQDPGCFMNRMNGCLPVTVKMMGSDNVTTIDLTIIGVENEKCHFQRKINNVVDMNCYFPKGTMNWDTIDQTFGNDKGLQQLVDDSCTSGW
jgi:hypothetical protein